MEKISNVDIPGEFIELLDAMIKIDEICSKKCMEHPLYNIHNHDNFVGSISALKRVKRILTDPEYYEGMKSLYL